VVTDSEAVAQFAEPAPTAVDERRGSWHRVLVVAGIVVVACAVLGALGGWLWYHWWGPPNKGTIYDTTQGPLWFDSTDKGIAQQFDGPAQYAVIALGLGLLVGVAAALFGRRQALAAVGGLVVGAALAAYLSWAIGTAMSPPDPSKYATEANICQQAPCKEYPAQIELSGWTPLLCWPIGALGGFSVTVVVSQWAEDFRRSQAQQKDSGNWLDRSSTGA
jgi:hypothetical protein